MREDGGEDGAGQADAEYHANVADEGKHTGCDPLTVARRISHQRAVVGCHEQAGTQSTDGETDDGETVVRGQCQAAEHEQASAEDE